MVNLNKAGYLWYVARGEDGWLASHSDSPGLPRASWSKAGKTASRRRSQVTTGAVPTPPFWWNPGIPVFFDVANGKKNKLTVTCLKQNIIINSALICGVGSNSKMFKVERLDVLQMPGTLCFLNSFEHFEYTWQTHLPFFLRNLWARTLSELFQFLLCYCLNWCLWLPCCFLPCHRLEPHLAGEQTWRNVITARKQGVPMIPASFKGW